MDASSYSTIHMVTDEVICVFGSGNALVAPDAQFRVKGARKYLEKLNGLPIVVALYGCHMPKMTGTQDSEALTMQKYWLLLDNTEMPVITKPSFQLLMHDEPDLNSISSECAAIVQDYLAHGDKVHLVINWPHMPRTYFLLRHHALKQKLDWTSLRENVRLVHNVPSANLAYTLLYELAAWPVNLYRIARQSISNALQR